MVLWIHVNADITPLVLIGDPVPGTANFRFTSVGPAVVNASGTIAFGAGFVDPATNVSGEGIFKIDRGQLLPVILEGQTAPDDAALAFGASAAAQINDFGDIVFISYLSVFQRRFQAIFEKSGDTLRRIVDFDTPVPGAAGQRFDNFNSVQINNQGDIAFRADLAGGTGGRGIFLMSGGQLKSVAVGLNIGSFSLNNRGDIAFQVTGTTSGSSGISVFSGGSVRSVVTVPTPVPGTNLMIQGAGSPDMNDDGDIAFISQSLQPAGRGGLQQVPNAIVRSRGGTLEKIVAAGDPVPGLNAFYEMNFLNTRLNSSGVLFTAGARMPNSPAVTVIGRSDNGRLTTVTSGVEYVEGIGTLDFIGESNFDRQQGPLVTFVSNAGERTEIGIYAAAGPQFNLRFPQIADGVGGANGNWRTSFVLGNRSTVPATATINFYNDAGGAVNLMVGGLQQSQTTVVVPALGVAEVHTEGGGPLATGWALVQSDQNLSGIAILSSLDASGNLVSEVGAPAVLPLRSLSVFVQAGANTFTGVAAANPNSVSADVTLILRDANSRELARSSVTIPPLGHLARYAAELFPGIPSGEFEGKLEIISTQPVAAMTLRQRASVFTSLPVIP